MANRGRYAVTDIDHRAPLGKARAKFVVLDQPLTQAIEALGNGFAGKAGQRFGTGVDLDARDDAELGQIVRERDAVAGFLPDGLVIEDHATDPLRDPRGREQQFAIAATMLLGGLATDLGQSLGDRGIAFIGRQQPLILRHHRRGHRFQVTRTHKSPVFAKFGPAGYQSGEPLLIEPIWY
jgi:hypothetical protein